MQTLFVRLAFKPYFNRQAFKSMLIRQAFKSMLSAMKRHLDIIKCYATLKKF